MSKGVIIMVILGSISTGAVYLNLKQDCTVDSAFEEKFNKHLKVLENYALVDFGSEELNNVLDAVSYINAITEIKSQIYLGDAVLYGEKEFKQDRKKWRKWYDENKCDMTLNKADSLYSVNVHLRPNHIPDQHRER